MGQQLLGKFQAPHVLERRRQRCPGEHRRARRGNIPSCAREALDHHVAALVIQLAILGDDVLRAVERGAGGRLDRREGAIVEIGFHPAHRRDQLLVADRKADPPAGHRIGLGQGRELDRDILGARHLQDGRRRIAVIIKLGISEVAQHPDLVLLRPGDEPFVEGQVHRLGRRVGRIIDHQDRRARHGEGHGAVERAEIILVRRRRHRPDGGSGDDEAEHVDRVAGVGRQHHVARRGDRGGEAGKPLLRPHGHDDFGFRVDIDAKAAAIIIGLGLAEARNPLGLGIAMGVRLARDFDQLGDDMIGRRQVGIAHAQVDNVLSRGAGCGSHRVHFGDDIGRQALHAVEFFGHYRGFPESSR